MKQFMHRKFCSGFGISAYYPHIFLLYNMLILSNHYMYIFFFILTYTVYTIIVIYIDEYNKSLY